MRYVTAILVPALFFVGCTFQPKKAPRIVGTVRRANGHPVERVLVALVTEPHPLFSGPGVISRQVARRVTSASGDFAITVPPHTHLYRTTLVAHSANPNRAVHFQ